MSTTESFNTGAEVQPLPRVVLSRVVLCGHPLSAEFVGALRDVSEIIPNEAVAHVSDLAELRAWIARNEFPDLLVIVQTWSDEFHFSDFLTLPGMGPFCRVICGYGPWCISDGRSRQDFPMAIRVPLEELRPALRREWQLLRPAARHPIPPWTAGRDEVFANRYLGWDFTPVDPLSAGKQKAPLAVRDELDAPASTSRIARVHSADHALSHAWKDALQAAGFSIATHEDSRTCGIVIWDADVYNESVAEEWRDLLHKSPATRIIAMTGFLVPDLADQMRSAGAAHVASKLLPLEVLRAELS